MDDFGPHPNLGGRPQPDYNAVPNEDRIKEARGLNRTALTVIQKGTLLCASAAVIGGIIHNAELAIQIWNACYPSYHCVTYVTHDIELAKTAFSLIPGFRDVAIGAVASILGNRTIMRLRHKP